MTFHDDAFGSYLWTDVADELDYYFVYGPELDQIVAELRALTGKRRCCPSGRSATCSPRNATPPRRSCSRSSGNTGAAAAARLHRAGLEVVDGRAVGSEDAGPGALPRPRTDDGRPARAARQADDFDLADHAAGRRRTGRRCTSRLSAGQPGHLRRLQPGRTTLATGTRPTPACSPRGSTPGGAIAPSLSRPTGRARSSPSRKNGCASTPTRPSAISTRH